MNKKQFTIEELFKNGFHYGHLKINSNTKMNPYIYQTRWNISIINLSLTAVLFSKALEALHEVAKKNGNILFVGTKTQIRDLVKQSALDSGQFYVSNRWIGGMITNMNCTVDVLNSKLNKIESNEESGYILNFSKKEQLKTDKKKTKILYMIEGVKKLKSKPDLLIVIDAQKEKNAILEANKLNIPVIALTDTDTSFPELITYLIPGNDESVLSVSFFLQKCVETINEAKNKKLEN